MKKTKAAVERSPKNYEGSEFSQYLSQNKKLITTPVPYNISIHGKNRNRKGSLEELNSAPWRHGGSEHKLIHSSIKSLRNV